MQPASRIVRGDLELGPRRCSTLACFPSAEKVTLSPSATNGGLVDDDRRPRAAGVCGNDARRRGRRSVLTLFSFVAGSHEVPSGLPVLAPQHQVPDQGLAPQRLRGKPAAWEEAEGGSATLLTSVVVVAERRSVHFDPAPSGARPSERRAALRDVEPDAEREVSSQRSPCALRVVWHPPTSVCVCVSGRSSCP